MGVVGKLEGQKDERQSGKSGMSGKRKARTYGSEIREIG